MIGLAFALGAAASLSDIRERIIPNAAVLALAACGLAFQLMRAVGAVLGADVVWAFAFACLGGAVFALVRGEKGFPMAPWLTLGCALVCAAFLLIGPR